MKKRLLLSLFLLFVLSCAPASAEGTDLYWLWDISLFDDVDSVVSQLADITGADIEKVETKDPQIRYYQTQDRYSGFRIQSLPFGMNAGVCVPNDAYAEKTGLEKGKEIISGFQMNHRSEFDEASGATREDFISNATSNFKLIYQMIAQKCGEPKRSYMKVTNGSVFGTYTLFESEWPNVESFTCPSPDSIDMFLYKESMATYVSFHYSWGNIQLSAGFSIDDTPELTLNIQEGIGELMFSDLELKGDYFDYVKKHSVGITSF